MLQWTQLPMPKNKAIILEVKGELDTEGVRALEPVFLELCTNPEPHLILDCTQLRYVNSLGLGLLVTGLKRRGEQGHKLVLAGLQEPIRRLFEVVRFNRIFLINETIGQALEAIDGPTR